ncbi:MAG: hypothetical protein IPI74_11695 [Bacteroidales bacterium]|nr:hypothetical protein [Bacteroidales bacterium]
MTSISRNVGTMYNQGIEFRLGVDAVKRGDFNWNIDVNMSTVKNEITKLPQEEIIQGTKKLMVGHSIYDFGFVTGMALIRQIARLFMMQMSRTLQHRNQT